MTDTKTNKVVLTGSYGVFTLCDKILKQLEIDDEDDVSRHDHRLVKVVEKLQSDKAHKCKSCDNLVVIDIDGGKYRIIEYDGMEFIETPDSIKWITI